MRSEIIQLNNRQLQEKLQSCWVIYDEGKTGTGNQCIGLAETLGFSPEIKAVRALYPWRFLPPRLRFNPLTSIVETNGKPIVPPWPDIIIAAGRASVAPSAAIRREAQNFVIQVLDPCINPKHFDLVVAPAHDNLAGDNVIVTEGALHQITQEKLEQAASQFKARFRHLPTPLVAVLIGGTSKRYSLTPKIIAKLCHELKQLSQKYGVGLVITPSRRTEPENLAMLKYLMQDASCVIWDGKSENPYMGLLALADYIIVTSDSVSMTSEACYTGKPVYTYNLAGGSVKSNRFHALFQNKGYTRIFEGELEKWNYPHLDELPSVVKKIKAKLTHCF